MKNVRKHYIYNSKFTLNVLNLKQIKLATNGDKLWKLDFWARLFKATTWEELKMLAQQDNVFQETCDTVFRLNQDEKIRYWCQAREEAERIARTIEQDYEDRLAKKDNALAEKDKALAEKDKALAEKDKALAEKDAQLALLKAQLNQK